MSCEIYSLLQYRRNGGKQSEVIMSDRLGSPPTLPALFRLPFSLQVREIGSNSIMA